MPNGRGPAGSPSRWPAKIDVEPGTDLADAVDALRSTVPRDSSLGDEWVTAFNAFKDLCGQVPLENFGIMGWTGG